MTTRYRGRKAGANPTKAFFVSMITRDITLGDSILDLIDNSVDGAWRSEGSKPMGLADDVDLSAYAIWIAASPDQFSIRDNCGGMTLDDAADHAFSFGRPEKEEPDDYSIGVYGIGMKRAAFKLGREISIKSTYGETDGTRQTFAVPIKVNEWLQNDAPPWDFDIVEDEELNQNGVEIVVKRLTQGAKTAFGNPAFLQNLRRTIARDYSLHLNRGLNIVINEGSVKGMPIELRKSADYAPMRVQYKERLDDEVVDVDIIGGMAAPPPVSIDPAENVDGDKRFGWYVACNGRIVLAADKTSVAGWGTSDWPQWHRQYSGFIGIVHFTAPHAVALPLTTTKRSVDVSSEIYLRARPRMREVSKQWIAYTNARKHALDIAKQKEHKAKAIPIQAVEKRDLVTLPKFAPVQVVPTANVNYSVALPKMKRLAAEFGSVGMPYREVGLKSFDYAYEDFVGDE